MELPLLIVATRNRHKVGEIRAILGEQFRLQSLDGFPGAPPVIEDATTFAGNATKKAVEVANWLNASGSLRAARNLPRRSSGRRRGTQHGFASVLADDSGLEVDALGGAPGVHSARFAALESGETGNSSDEANRARLLRLLEGVPAEKRTARFRCVLALTPVSSEQARGASPVCYADEAEFQTRLFEGVCEGRIKLVAQGSGGFGYDPLFIPEGYNQTFGELSEETKNRLSHRAKALARMSEAIKQPNPGQLSR
jgi:XTP/dITP diphosphohydrolase